MASTLSDVGVPKQGPHWLGSSILRHTVLLNHKPRASPRPLSFPQPITTQSVSPSFYCQHPCFSLSTMASSKTKLAIRDAFPTRTFLRCDFVRLLQDVDSPSYFVMKTSPERWTDPIFIRHVPSASVGDGTRGDEKSSSFPAARPVAEADGDNGRRRERDPYAAEHGVSSSGFQRRTGFVCAFVRSGSGTSRCIYVYACAHGFFLERVGRRCVSVSSGTPEHSTST